MIHWFNASSKIEEPEKALTVIDDALQYLRDNRVTYDFMDDYRKSQRKSWAFRQKLLLEITTGTNEGLHRALDIRTNKS